MIKDIIQNIKITAQTDKATAKLNQMKATMNTIPKQIQLKTQNYNKAIDSMKTLMLSLAAIATTAISVIRKGFLGLAEQQQSIKRLNTAIQITGTQATLSATALWDYFQTLQSGTGQAADELATIASKFVSAGIASQSMVRQYTNAAVGLAQQTGKSVDEVSDKLIRAIQGQTKGLKQFGIATNTGATAQQLLNEALRRGSIAFNNIDTNSATRSMMIFRQSFNNMLQGFAQKFLPAISSMINFIAKNLNVIGNILLGAAIFGTMKSIYNIAKAIYALTLGQGAALVRQIKTKLQLSAIDIERLQLLAAQGLITSNQQKALERQLITQELYNKLLNGTISLSSTLSSIFSKSNIILAAATVALTLILNNWTKIKQKITGVSQQQRKLWASSAQLLGNQISQMAELIGQIKWYANQQKLTNEQINHRNELIKTYNNSYAQKYGGNLLNQKNLITDIGQAAKNLTLTLKKLTQQKIKQALIESKTDVFVKYAQNIIKAQQLANKYKQQLSAITQGLYCEESEAQKSSWDTKTKYLQLKINQQQKIIAKWKGKIQKQFQDIVKITSQFAVQVPSITGGTGTGKGKGETPKPIKIPTPIVDTSMLQYFKSLLAGAQITKNVTAQTQSLKRIIGQLTLQQRNYIINTSDSDKETIKYRKTIQDMTNDINTYKNKLIELNAVPAVTDPFTGPALQDIQVSPIQQWMSQFTTKAWQTSTMLQMAWVNVFDSIAVAWDGLASKIGSGFAAVIMQGQSFSKAMKNIFKDFASAIIAQISKIIVKLIVALTLKNLLGGFIGGIFGGGSSTATLSGNLLDTYNLASIGKGSKTSSSNSIISISTSNLLYSGKNNLINKLDEVITAVSNIQPVQTQIIDLPTLATANKIGNAMILQGV